MAGESGRDCGWNWTVVASWLVGTTMAYNTVEAVIAIWSGVVADSVALVGFGFDSVIEASASGLLLWRLAVESGGADREVVERAERRVHYFVGMTFIALAFYVMAQATWVLLENEPPRESVVGIVLAIVSLIIMPFVAWGKIHASRKIQSPALLREAKETLACSYLSFALLIGLLGNALAGWWWADPVAAMAMVPWLFKEGVEGLRGEDACD